MEKPLVSVVMPVYNGERYIGKAIESALGQEVPVEVLVIDDCSADGTELAVMKYMDSGKIRYIQNEQNMGAARSRNRGVKEARGKYIAFLDADDWWQAESPDRGYGTDRLCDLLHRKRADDAGWAHYQQIYSGKGTDHIQGASEA